MASSKPLQLDLAARESEKSNLRGVLAVVIPSVITTSSRAMMDVADFVMISTLGHGKAQAAILPAQMIMFTYIVFGMGIVSMASTFAAQSLGRKRYRECSAYAWQTLYVSAVLGVVALACVPFLEGLIAYLGHDPEVQAMELAYARIAMLSAGPSMAAFGLGNFFIGIHRPMVTMWSAIEANCVNVVVSAVLIFGVIGEPMGIAGAAWGTLVAVSYRTVRLLLSMNSASMDATYGSRSTWRPSVARLRNLLRTGIPTAVQWFSEVIVWAIFVNVLIGKTFGTDHLIATSTAWQYMRIAFMPTIGLGMALTSLVGKAIGAEIPHEAIRLTRLSVGITLVYMCSLSIVYAVWGSELIGLFNDKPEIMRIGAQIMMCAAVFQLFDALGINYSSALRGAGDTFVPLVFFVISTWLIIIGGGFVAVSFFPEYGSLGPWIAAAGFISISGSFLWWRWHRRAWMKINIFKHDVTDTFGGTGEAVETTVAPEETTGTTEPSTTIVLPGQ
ncbi:MAG: MATE family efflux transporter [Planctomycetes bacterium]|nr:MATE family efflux transporter [Planctomycetota bacterium]